MHQAHLLVAGEQHESPAAAVFQNPDHFFGGGLCEGGAARFRQVLRHVEQRLTAVVKVAGHYQGTGVIQAQPLFGVLEAASHGQGCRRQNRGLDLAEQAFGHDLGDVDGSGLEKASAAAGLHPVDKVFVI